MLHIIAMYICDDSQTFISVCVDFCLKCTRLRLYVRFYIFLFIHHRIMVLPGLVAGTYSLPQTHCWISGVGRAMESEGIEKKKKEDGKEHPSLITASLIFI